MQRAAAEGPLTSLVLSVYRLGGVTMHTSGFCDHVKVIGVRLFCTKFWLKHQSVGPSGQVAGTNVQEGEVTDPPEGGKGR